ncbi:hypothetical protein PGT21_021685 [Puccinia graminis f. sp. tritici]|uniref:RING-type domain-containing protein n=2 Tax=Puccinia graminis f. sp. tritici TaxID=56615 RepID=E3KC85_PUCGT|nr:uncharacterized protein PGTG_08270 [Puccinia graminis f. sp. tritici CRL 75-36-700-3]EFP82021.1 hypothetical protein PGTG_08270 [Puccinia graminis f. sp. tritici CRL 75-36-700-3]KAA1117741.1 hypothetical protein PGT21_021685 [Puccinia graminis f. sp. tritici]KAA1138031.1 hypothetical protein PGTUg99_024929 [Puccinia graminis f. sp. tritici]
MHPLFQLAGSLTVVHLISGSSTMAHSTASCSSGSDTELDLWAEFPDAGGDGPSENKPRIGQDGPSENKPSTGQPADQPLDTPHRIKRSSSTEETAIDPIPHKSSEKRAREPDDQDKSNDRPLKIQSTSSHSPQTQKPSKSSPMNPKSSPINPKNSPMNPKSSPINPPAATKNEDSDSQSLGNLTCAICLSAPSPAVVTKCGHVTCGECLASSIVSQHNSSYGVFPPFLQPVGARINNGQCPVCRAPLVGGWGTAMRGVILKVRKAP